MTAPSSRSIGKSSLSSKNPDEQTELAFNESLRFADRVTKRLFSQAVTSSLAPLANLKDTCKKQENEIARLKKENETLKQQLARLSSTSELNISSLR